MFGEVLGEAVNERFEVGVTTHEFQVHIRVFTDAHFIEAAIAVCQCAFEVAERLVVVADVGKERRCDSVGLTTWKRRGRDGVLRAVGGWVGGA